MYLITIPLLYAETLLVGLRSHSSSQTQFLPTDALQCDFRSYTVLVSFLWNASRYDSLFQPLLLPPRFRGPLASLCLLSVVRRLKELLLCMAGVTGFEPVECRSQSPVPYQFGYTPIQRHYESPTTDARPIFIYIPHLVISIRLDGAVALELWPSVRFSGPGVRT